MRAREKLDLQERINKATAAIEAAKMSTGLPIPVQVPSAEQDLLHVTSDFCHLTPPRPPPVLRSRRSARNPWTWSCLTWTSV